MITGILIVDPATCSPSITEPFFAPYNLMSKHSFSFLEWMDGANIYTLTNEKFHTVHINYSCSNKDINDD